MTQRCKLCLLLVMFLALTNLSGATYYVSKTGDDGNSGLSWAGAFLNVQTAIDQAHSDGGGEVWVAQGTYYPTQYIVDAEGQRDASDGDYYKSFSMYAGVNVYGGFNGTETSTAQRQMNSSDPWDFTYPTILDGQDTSYHVVWFCTNGFHDESYEGITAKLPNSLTSQAILDGFTVENGYAAYPGNIENATAPRNNIGHFSGGGVALTGLGEVNNCIVQSNRAKHSGAGVSMQFNSIIYNSLIQNNEAIGAHFIAKILFITIADFWRADGAGISARGNDTDGRPLIDNCKIINNLGQANNNYPGTPSTTTGNYNLGGGVALYFADLTNSVISSNNIKKAPYPYGGTDSGPSCGGGIYLYANGTIVNCEVYDNGFVDNDAQNGAGIFVEDYTEHAGTWTDILVKDCYVHSNRAGGAIANDAHYSQIENCVVANNMSSAVYGYGNCENSRTVNCLIYNNQSSGWVQSTNANNRNNWLINSTVVKNGSGISATGTNTYYVRNSVAWGNNSNPSIPANVLCEYSAFSFTPPAGTGNFQVAADNSDVMFVSPTASAGVNQAGWQDAVWSVQAGSDLVDAGYNSHILSITTADILGNARNQGAAVDIGAYEFTLYQLSLSVHATGGGVVIIDNNGSTSGSFAPGTEITIQGTPDSGYDFWKWTDSEGVTVSKIDEMTFSMPGENVAMVGYFSENPNAPTAGLPSGMSVPVETTIMSWTAPASGVTPTGYQVFLYSEADGYNNPIIDGVSVSGTSYNGMYLEMNTTYMAEVYAEFDPDAKGFSEPLQWYFKTENIITYNVSLADDPDGSGIVLIQNNGSASGDFEAGTVLDITATPQSGWNFWKWTEDGVTVSTIDDFQYTVPAESVQLLAHFYQDPQAPTNGLPNGSAELVTVDTLSWSAPVSGSVPTSYTVELYSDADLYAVPIIDTEVTDTFYAPLDLEFGTSYKVKVYSNFDPEAKVQSAALQWFFTTEEGSLGVPAVTITGFDLIWTAVEGATGYRIYSSPDPYGTEWVLEAEVGAVTSWTDPDTSPTKKFYRITAIK